MSPCRFKNGMCQFVFNNVHIDCAAGGTPEGGAEQGDGAELGAADSGLPAAADAGADCGRRSRCGCRAGGAAVQAAMKPSMIHCADPPAGRRLCRRALAALRTRRDEDVSVADQRRPASSGRCDACGDGDSGEDATMQTGSRGRPASPVEGPGTDGGNDGDSATRDSYSQATCAVGHRGRLRTFRHERRHATCAAPPCWWQPLVQCKRSSGCET